MGARYTLVRNPNPEGDDKKQALHARVVPYGTVGIDQLMENAQGRSTFTAADIRGALQIIADLMAERLEEGYNVELEGIGFFSVSLSSRPVMEKKEIRSESIHFKNVNFRCGKYLRDKLKTMPLTRLKEEKADLVQPAEREQRLMHYLEKHHYITSSTYRGLTGCTKYSALQDLNRLVEEGKLQTGGYRSTRIYLMKAKADK